ncbi:MAG: IclR family transcriptional regulator C-terminal domain-containing protein, partial [Paracoccaceae bacterium]|nr:IclR family transcriptional regulator C-terminal domain-containing protein [Paracoccaceae bacterium]
PTTIEAIISQAKSDQKLGAAWSQGNFESGIGSCAAAIFDHTGLPVGGLNVSGPESRFSEIDDDEGDLLRKILIDAAGTASAEMGFVA